MLKITRELVEHYLRATGWRPLKGGPTTYRHGSDNYDVVMASDPIDAAIKYIALATNVERHVVAFRFGLCAAAEELLMTAAALSEDIAIPKYHDKSLGEWRAVGRNLREEAADIMRLAGIDPAAWESASVCAGKEGGA